MKKLLVFILVLLIIFFFRGHLTGYWIKFFDSEPDKFTAEWLVKKRDKIYVELPELDILMAKKALTEFESSIKAELAKLDKTEGDERKKKNYRRNLICELPIIYRKMATVYLQNGEDQQYMEYIQKSQAKMVSCTELK